MDYALRRVQVLQPRVERPCGASKSPAPKHFHSELGGTRFSTRANLVDDRHLLPVGYLCHACLFGCASQYNVGVAVNLSRNHDFADLRWRRRRGVNRRRCSLRGTIGATPNEILNARESLYVPPADADKLHGPKTIQNQCLSQNGYRSTIGDESA